MKQNLRIVVILAVIVLLVVSCVGLVGCGGEKAPSATEQKLADLPPGTVVANAKKGVYHSPDCELAKKIPVEELATFKSAAEAKDAFCSPCKECQ